MTTPQPPGGQGQQAALTDVNAMTPVQAFRWYNEHGFIALPAHPVEKKLALPAGYHFNDLSPLTEADIQAAERNWHLDLRVALIMSESSGMVAIDVDDLSEWARWLGQHEIGNPACQMSGRAEGGFHLVYQRDGISPSLLKQGAWSGDYPHIEVKAKGLIIAAPSLHASGRRYLWTSGAPLPAPAPAGLFDSRTAVSSYSAGLEWPPKLTSENLLAQKLVRDVLTGQYLWTPGQHWLAWDGRKWARTPDEDIIETARRYANLRYVTWKEESARLAREGDDEAAKTAESCSDAWLRCSAYARIRAAVSFCRGMLRREDHELDAHPDLLNCPNGVVDLHTGELRGHDPALLLTKLARAEYRPGATHLDVTMALQAVPEDSRGYLQLRLGQAITGHKPPDDVIFFLVGGGENGKTTLTYGVAGAAGDYFVLVSERAITADKSQHPTELMDFRGARMAVLEELTEGRWLNVRRLKIITGEEITARLCGHDDVTFGCTHALFISSNYLPVIAETDHGTWRRLLLLTFPFRFAKRHEMTGAEDEKEGSPGLRERVHDGGDGRREAFLAWLVAGAVRWYAGEPGREPKSMGEPPARVRDGTRAWREGASPLAAWASERLTEDSGTHVMSADLYGSFSEYLRATGHPSWSENVFTARLAEHFGRKATKQRIRARDGLSRPAGYGYPTPPPQYAAWLGIRFKTEDEMLADSEKPQGVQGVQPYLAGGNFSAYTGPAGDPARPAQVIPGGDWAAWHAMADFEAAEG